VREHVITKKGESHITSRILNLKQKGDKENPKVAIVLFLYFNS